MYESILNGIKSKMNDADVLIEKLKGFLDDDVDACLSEDISALINALSASVLKAKELPREFGIVFDYDAVGVDMDVRERYINGIFNGYHFILPMLLDKRDTNSSYSKTRELTKHSYAEAFERYASEKGFEHISSKVLITYINHYIDARRMIDNDNIDTKGFTDLITMHILDDDDPLRADLFIKGVVDGSQYTEVFVEII